MTYDLSPYVSDEDRMWLQTRVTWTPRDGGDTVSVTSDYVDGVDGYAHLGCGIESILPDLGLPHFDDSEKYLLICDLINRQLAWRPWAELVCPEGTARLELVVPPPR